jgi:hypothetical protein
MNETDKESPAGRIKNSFGKFTIGVLAGLCAALLPRLLAMLAHTDDASLRVVPTPYLVASCGFALLIGGLVVIFEWEITDTPRNIFMTALALPAVISGALSTSNGIGNGAEANRELDRARLEIRKKDGILRQGEFSSSVQPLDSSPATAPNQSFWTPLFPIGAVYAQQQTPFQAAGDTPARFGIYFEQPKYVIVLKQAKTEKEAIEAAQELKRRLPRAQAVKADNNYYVLLGSADGQNETEALLEASRAKALLADSKIQPRLVQLKR